MTRIAICMLVAFGTARADGSQPLFGSRTITIDAYGQYPTLVPFDFDRDGRSELIVNSTGVTEVFSFGADSLFVEPWVSNPYGRFRKAAIADIDRDGAADLIYATDWPGLGSGGLIKRTCNPDRTLGPPVELPPINWFEAVSRGIAVGDVDRDGFLDIAAATSYTARVRLGGPVADTMRTLPGGSGRDGLDLADLDHDGNLDAVSLGGGVLVVHRGIGNGYFEQFGQEHVGGPHLSVVDWNEDGHEDLISGNYRYEGLGDGTFALHDVLPFDVHSVVDVDLDGRVDMLVLEESGLAIARGAGDWAYEVPSRVTSARHPTDVAVADFDGDGAMDLAISGGRGSAITLVLSRIAEPRAREYATGPAAIDLALRDLTADGVRDVVTLNRGERRIAVLRGLGDGSFGPPTKHEVAAGARALATTDVDGNGIVDLLAVSDSASQLSVLRGLGGGDFADAEHFMTGPEPVSMTVADFDRDGHADVVTANSGDQSLTLLRGDGEGGFAVPEVVASISYLALVASQDMNDDGWLDLIVATGGGSWHMLNPVYLIPGIGGGHFGPSQSTGHWNRNPSHFAVDDVDGDGCLDWTAAASTDSADVTLAHGKWTRCPSSTPGPVESYFPTRTALSDFDVADIDGDGGWDFVLLAEEDNEVLVDLRPPGGSRFTRQGYGVGDGPMAMEMGDVNGDGLTDIVTANSRAGTISVLLRAGAQPPPLAVDIPVSTGVAFHGVRPQPATGPLRVTFTLPSSRHVTCDLFDLHGRRLRSYDAGLLAAGDHAIEVPGSRLAPGVYSIRLTAGAESLRRPAVVVR
jgi:hypothetical protein